MNVSGQKPKLAPGHNNKAGYLTIHLIHDDLKVYRFFGMIVSTFVKQESTVLGGDRRLYADSPGIGSLTFPYCTQAALAAILAHINFNGLDALVTIRHWDGEQFRDYNATLQYLPPADQQTNFCEVFPVRFDIIDMVEIA